MRVFATWIAGPKFSVSWQRVKGHITPVVALELDNYMKRGTGEVSYKSAKCRRSLELAMWGRHSYELPVYFMAPTRRGRPLKTLKML
jgi:hypothetical protein